MKRLDTSEDNHQNKEPRLEDCESSRPLQPDVGSSSVKCILRRSLELKQTKQSEEIASKSSVEGTLKQWAEVFANASYHCEVRSLIVSERDVSPALESAQGRESPSFALIVEQSSNLFFKHTSGPFQAARLVIYADGEWRLDSPIHEHQSITRGKLEFPVESSHLVDIAQRWLSNKHVLCPGSIGLSDLQKDLGYIPKTVKVVNGDAFHSKKCKAWHIPSSNYKQDSSFSKMCGECLICYRYVKRAIESKKSLDCAKCDERRNPSSNYPLKYLSPKSKAARSGNSRQQRSRFKKQVRKLYKRTRVELPQEQSSELCKLMEAIESSDEGKMELQNIYKEGNQYKNNKGGKAGNFLKDIWQKDHESFFKDQRNNGELDQIVLLQNHDGNKQCYEIMLFGYLIMTVYIITCFELC